MAEQTRDMQRLEHIHEQWYMMEAEVGDLASLKHTITERGYLQMAKTKASPLGKTFLK